VLTSIILCWTWFLLIAARAPADDATPAETLELMPGFHAQRIYNVPKDVQGSWVSMTFDPKGRIIASDQGGPLYRVTLHGDDQPDVERLDTPLGEAQGLLCAFDNLYVVVNGGRAQGSGLYRLRDTNGDDQYDELRLLKKFDGGGEHGPHGVVTGPEGKLYVMAGNFTKPPEGLSPDSPHRNWAEDLLLPRQPDGNGFATGVMAPGGWVAHTDPDGNQWDLFCGGFRNAYDLAFNLDGELFTYDADMEWDLTTPWYRPTRVNHCTSAAEFGWRYGTGKWPAYYADSLGGFDIGLGSPTGVVFGTGAKFPAKYQRAFYVLDWSYGKIYAMHLTPQGAGYSATFEPFVVGKPLPVTDVAVGPDGALYFTTGGRGTQSGLYRITYTGAEPTDPAGPLVDTTAEAARRLRRSLEKFHARHDPSAIDAAWPHLDSDDRVLRYAARVAIERVDPALWQAKALAETRTTAGIALMVALARTGTLARTDPLARMDTAELLGSIVDRLNRLPLDQLTEEQQLDALRAYGLAFIRLGKPDAATAASLAARLDGYYPSRILDANRELCQLLTYLESPWVVAKSMKLLYSAMTQAEQMHYVFVLRNARTGWDLEMRKAYFSWLNLAGEKYQGGASYKGFLENIRKDALETLSDAERVALAPVLEAKESVKVVANEMPRKFVQAWQMADLAASLEQTRRGRSFDLGREAFHAAQCGRCHRFQSEGGSVGHDLTGVGNRFSAAEVLESVLLPSKVISDQYASKTLLLADGRSLTGAVAPAVDGWVNVLQSSGEQVRIAENEIDEIVPSKLSIMPEGLVNILTRDEILDLIAYLRSGGNRDDRAFAKD
jgi:putative heme-binding domain-containing protein